MPNQELAATDRASPVAFSRAYRAWLLTVLLLVTALYLGDRQGFAIVGQAIKVELRLTDGQLGVLYGLVYALFSALLGLPFARLAERVSRTKLLALSVGAFGVMVALCSRVESFWQLLLLRVGVVVGDAGLGAPTASLIGDHYGSERRGSAMAIAWVGGAIGVTLGPLVGGWLAQHVGWRAVFLAIGLPAIVLGATALVSLREPRRGILDPVGSSEGPLPSMWMVLRFLLAKPAVRHVWIGYGLAASAMMGVGQFMAQFLVRQYHIGFAEVGRVIALPYGIAWASGMLIGGLGIDWAVRRFDRRWYVWGPAIALLVAAPAFLIAFTRPSVIGAAAAVTVGFTMLFIYWAPTLALAQNMVSANMRASSAYLTSLMFSLFGAGIGPTLVGLLSDMFGSRAFGGDNFRQLCSAGVGLTHAASRLRMDCANASAEGLRDALMVVSLLAFWAGVHYWLAARTLRQDLDTRYAPQPELAGGPSIERV